MRNAFETTITLRRIDICDLLIACTALSQQTDSKKWTELHDKLEAQLISLDEQLDNVIAHYITD